MVVMVYRRKEMKFFRSQVGRRSREQDSAVKSTLNLGTGCRRETASQVDNFNLSTRLTEHKRATRNGDVNNHIAEHHLQTKHQIDWDSATCITYSTDYYQRLTLESWFTNLEQTPLNRSQQLPAPYK